LKSTAYENGRMERVDYEYVVDMVPEGSKVLDLGCGDGELMLRLARRKKCSVSGIEIDGAMVRKSIEKGLCVLEADIDESLRDYSSGSFDVVLLSQTIQVTRSPQAVLREMLRVGKRGIVSTPNFAHWRVRYQLTTGGTMPKTRELPFEWYETPNIHMVTIKDFKRFCMSEGITIEREIYLGESHRTVKVFPNFFARTAIWSLRG